MGEYKTQKERYHEVLDKLQKCQEEQIGTIDKIMKGNDEIIKELEKRDDELENAQKALATCPPKEVRRWEAIVRTIDTRKHLLSVRKMALKEKRLALTYLLKMEGKIKAELMDFEE